MSKLEYKRPSTWHPTFGKSDAGGFAEMGIWIIGFLVAPVVVYFAWAWIVRGI